MIEGTDSEKIVDEEDTAMKEIRKRTRMVEFSRQLWPQPPKNSRPHFCYINTLIFYDKDLNEVWKQEIPEAEFHVRAQDSIDRVEGPRVEFDETWGWILKFTLTHEAANAMWDAFEKYTLEQPCPWHTFDDEGKCRKCDLRLERKVKK